ncbi:MAG: AAA family ATPase, partial [Actinomycetota bacterium]
KIEFVLKRQPNELKLKIHGDELDFDVLPDGLRSLISWIPDFLSTVDLLKWQDDLPITEKNLILLLDEIEVHLHPAWQRKVLPVVQKLFKNSQIFVSTHSPFVVNSVDDAWVYKLELNDGKTKVTDIVKSEDGISYQTVLREIFGIDEEFGGKTQNDLDKFYGIVRNGKKIAEKKLKRLAKSLAEQSEELNAIVQIELNQLSRRKGKKFSL